MKKVTFLIVLFILFGCKNENKERGKQVDEEIEANTIENLPEGKWNGEYIKIDDDDEPKNKKKSHGSEFYSLGMAYVRLGDYSIDVKTFKQRQSSMSFNNHQINAFIKGVNSNEDIRFYIKKPSIIQNYQGNYTLDPSGEKKNGIKIEVILEDESFVLVEGRASIINFDYTVGALELTFDGSFSNKSNVAMKGEGKVKVKFDNTIRIPDE